ncbi:LysR family transcriptional regulator [Burkholderia savannae]|uniref:LysR family transcriptional regulator n=1 Tax=Burkholderia savannae TaxID=1637837 RepID=A0ABR5TCY6_9BURK|nr:LysR family transcriptional regulator [Burkholderia savannae]KWZ39961.1 LysR family transcriptional regulator [Burkholderia savannae]
MNTRFLETFVLLAQLESFRATARVLHATPATISLRIRSLEDELKTELVDRSTTRFRLTPSGQSLLGIAKNVVDAARALREAAGQEVVVGGKLRLGVIETVVHSWLARYITQLNSSFPKLEVDLSVDSSAVLQRRLLSGDLDLAIRVEGIDSTKIVSSAIASYPVRWIAKRGLLSKRAQGLALRVLQRPVLTFGRGTAPQVALDSIVHALAQEVGMPIEQTRITCSPSVAAIIQLVRDGYGVAAIPGLFVAEALQSGEFIELPLKPVPPPIIVSLCKPVNANLMIHAAASAAQVACSAYCQSRRRDLVEAL